MNDTSCIPTLSLGVILALGSVSHFVVLRLSNTGCVTVRILCECYVSGGFFFTEFFIYLIFFTGSLLWFLLVFLSMLPICSAVIQLYAQVLSVYLNLTFFFPLNGLCFTALSFFFSSLVLAYLFVIFFFYLLCSIGLTSCCSVLPHFVVHILSFPWLFSMLCFLLCYIYFFSDFRVCTLQTLWLGVLYVHTHIMLGSLISSGPCDIKLHQSPNLCN